MKEQLELSEIRQLYADNPNDIETCRRIAAMPHVPFKVLNGMAESDNVEIQALAAAHGELDPKYLQKLSKHGNELVRCAVASNKALGPATTMNLTKDPSPFVRITLARNPKIPLPAQIALSEDHVPFVRAELLNRKNLDEEIQYALCCDVDLTIHVKALLYPKLDLRWLKHWAENGTKLSMIAIAKRKNLPEEIAAILKARGVATGK